MKPKYDGLTVSRVAELSGLTVRTLHHYDRIRLVRPGARSPAGYRLYDGHDLRRLQQILFFRELGFALKDIRRIMSATSFDQRRALAAQRKLLAEKRDRVNAMVDTIDRILAAPEGGTMDKQDFEMFAGFNPGQYEAEVQKRWGQTKVFAESSKRTARYTKADWQKIKAEADAMTADFAEKLRAGVPATAVEVLAIAERHRRHVDHWYYPCPRAMHANLGRTYVADERFAATYEKLAKGLAAYVCDAIVANAARSA